ALGVGGPVLRQEEAAVQRRVAAGGGVGQEDADLAVVELTQPAAPLPADAAGGRALLGEAAAVHDEHAAGVAHRLGDVAAQLSHDRFVVPGAGADKVLHRLAGVAGLVGDGLRRLALQAAEAALDDQRGQVALLTAV